MKFVIFGVVSFVSCCMVGCFGWQRANIQADYGTLCLQLEPRESRTLLTAPDGEYKVTHTWDNKIGLKSSSIDDCIQHDAYLALPLAVAFDAIAVAMSPGGIILDAFSLKTSREETLRIEHFSSKLVDVPVKFSASGYQYDIKVDKQCTFAMPSDLVLVLLKDPQFSVSILDGQYKGDYFKCQISQPYLTELASLQLQHDWNDIKNDFPRCFAFIKKWEKYENYKSLQVNNFLTQARNYVNPEAYVKQAKLMMESKNFEGALHQVTNALVLSPTHAEALKLKEEVQHAITERAEQERELQRRENIARSIEADWETAQQDGRVSKYQEFWNKWKKQDPQTHIKIADIQQQAKKMLEVETYQILAKNYSVAREYDKAIFACRNMLELDSNSTWAKNSLEEYQFLYRVQKELLATGKIYEYDSFIARYQDKPEVSYYVQQAQGKKQELIEAEKEAAKARAEAEMKKILLANAKTIMYDYHPYLKIKEVYITKFDPSGDSIYVKFTIWGISTVTSDDIVTKFKMSISKDGEIQELKKTECSCILGCGAAHQIMSFIRDGGLSNTLGHIASLAAPSENSSSSSSSSGSNLCTLCVYIKAQGILSDYTVEQCTVTIIKRKNMNGDYDSGFEKSDSPDWASSSADFYYVEPGYYEITATGYDKNHKKLFDVKTGDSNYVLVDQNTVIELNVDTGRLTKRK